MLFLIPTESLSLIRLDILFLILTKSLLLIYLDKGNPGIYKRNGPYIDYFVKGSLISSRPDKYFHYIILIMSICISLSLSYLFSVFFFISTISMIYFKFENYPFHLVLLDIIILCSIDLSQYRSLILLLELVTLIFHYFDTLYSLVLA